MKILNDKQFDHNLGEVCISKNLYPPGRSGLFKYLYLDEAIEVAFDMVAIAEHYLNIASVNGVK